MHEQGRQTLFVQLHRTVGFDLDILETVIRKIRRKRLDAFALQRIGIGLESETRQRFVIDVDIPHFDAAVRFLQFAVLHRDLRTLLSLHRQAAYSGHVFAEIENIHRIAERFYRNRTDLARRTDRRGGLRHQQRRRSLYLDGRAPRRIVETGFVPTRNLQPGVIRIAAVNVVLHVRPGSRFPRAVRCDDLLRTVRINDMQLADHPRPVAPARVFEIPGSDRCVFVIKPVAENGRKHVFARNEQPGHVIGTVQVPFVVMRITRFKAVRRNRLAVQPHLPVSRCAHVKTRVAYLSGYVERFAQHRRRSEALVVSVGNPAGRPARQVGLRRFEAVDRRHDDPSVIAPGHRIPIITGTGLQRLRRVVLRETVHRNDLRRRPYVAVGQRIGQRRFRRSDAHPAALLHEIVVAHIIPCKPRRGIRADSDRGTHVFAPHIRDFRPTLRAAGQQKHRQRRPGANRIYPISCHSFYF